MSWFSGNLYVKTTLWMLLNLLLLGVLGVLAAGYMLLETGYDGILPASLFSARSDSVLRVISSNLQYRPAGEWMGLLRPHAEKLPVKLHVATLDTETIVNGDIPEKMAAQAKGLPRATYTFCPEPEVLFWDPMGNSMFASRQGNAEYGLPPVPPALFRITSGPLRFWLGRVMYIPDHNRQIHTVLVALESDSLTGRGLFFDMRSILLQIAAILGISFFWWLPFIQHISHPLRRMAIYAEEVEKDNFANVERPFLREKDFSGKRRDEVGRLGHALTSMIRHMHQTITGQSQFIRYVAHELNTPMAKAQMNLGVLECMLEGKAKERVLNVQAHIKKLSVLTDEVLTYLTARASIGRPDKQHFNAREFMESMAHAFARDGSVIVQAPENLCIFTDRRYLQRSLGNLLRNAFAYASDGGPVVLSAMEASGEVCIAVSDSGPGVSESDLPSLTEAFYRGRAAMTHPGGTGLGLSIVKDCTEACGGRMEYGNRRGGGFEVRLYFPQDAGECREL